MKKRSERRQKINEQKTRKLLSKEQVERTNKKQMKINIKCSRFFLGQFKSHNPPKSFGYVMTYHSYFLNANKEQSLMFTARLLTHLDFSHPFLEITQNQQVE